MSDPVFHTLDVAVYGCASKMATYNETPMIESPQEMKHTCDQCLKEFSRRKNLKRHIRDVHDMKASHRCGICSKKFKRRQHKELHLRTCSLTLGQGVPVPKKKKKSIVARKLRFTPFIRSSSFGGLATDWSIIYPDEYRYCDPFLQLKSSIKAMKGPIERQLYAKTMKLKYVLSIHVVFEKACEPDVKTVPSVVFRTDPDLIYSGEELDGCLQDNAIDLWGKIETYEGCGSGWTIDHLERLDASIDSF